MIYHTLQLIKCPAGFTPRSDSCPLHRRFGLLDVRPVCGFGVSSNTPVGNSEVVRLEGVSYFMKCFWNLSCQVNRRLTVWRRTRTADMEFVEVFDSPGKGRGLRATKELWAGDVLFSEAPFASVVFDRWDDHTAVHHPSVCLSVVFNIKKHMWWLISCSVVTQCKKRHISRFTSDVEVCHVSQCYRSCAMCHVWLWTVMTSDFMCSYRIFYSHSIISSRNIKDMDSEISFTSQHEGAHTRVVFSCLMGSFHTHQDFYIVY